VEKLIKEFLDKYKKTDVPNDQLAKLLMTTIRTNKGGWLMDLNRLAGRPEADAAFIQMAEEDWR